MEKMNPETKELWIKALRSGNYKQGTRRLRSAENEFCCLGVLCDIKNITKTKNNNSDCYFYGDKPGDLTTFSRTILPNDFRINTDVSLSVTAMNKLIDMNDIEGNSFYEIADWIEENI